MERERERANARAVDAAGVVFPWKAKVAARGKALYENTTRGLGADKVVALYHRVAAGERQYQKCLPRRAFYARARRQFEQTIFPNRTVAYITSSYQFRDAAAIASVLGGGGRSGAARSAQHGRAAVGRALRTGGGGDVARHAARDVAGGGGLSTAFDMPTLMGLDSDDVLSIGEVGRCGVAVDTLADMDVLYNGIDLSATTTSMTINAPAAAIWAMLPVCSSAGTLLWPSVLCPQHRAPPDISTAQVWVPPASIWATPPACSAAGTVL